MVITDMIVQTIFASSQKPLLRVLILNHQWLVGAAIASLLSVEGDLELNGLTATSASVLPEIIDRFSLDVIVVDNLMASDDDIQSLCTTFSHHPKTRVFIVRFDANVVHLDGMHPTVITQAGDLAILLRSSRDRSHDSAHPLLDVDD